MRSEECRVCDAIIRFARSNILKICDSLSLFFACKKEGGPLPMAMVGGTPNLCFAFSNTEHSLFIYIDSQAFRIVAKNVKIFQKN